MNTKMAYMYRDGSNYKTNSGYLIFQGTPSKKDFKAIKEMQENESPFVPSQVGLDDLQGNLASFDTFDYEDDHPFHEIVYFELTDEEPNSELNIKEIVKAILNSDPSDAPPYTHPKPTATYVASMIREGDVVGYHPYWELEIDGDITNPADLSDLEREEISERVEGLNTSGIISSQRSISWRIVT